MPAVVLGMKITSNAPGVALGRGEGRRWLAQQRYETMLSTAAYWHQRIFPRHFANAAAAEYGYERRSQFYLDVIKSIKGIGRGKQKGALEFLTGQSLRWMRDLNPQVTGKRNLTLRMRPPSYFTNPFIGTIGRDPRTGKVKRITRQPDKPAEVTQVSSGDNTKMIRHAGRFLARNVKKLPAPRVKTIK